MTELNRPLNDYSKNINSQFGEDGIIEEILIRLEAGAMTDGWCVEFGAWDGVYLSNTYNLIKNKGYKAVLIEGDPSKYKELCTNIPSPEAIKICEFVHFSGSSSLDNILMKTPIPKEFDFLSIDIDGSDYYIFESLQVYRPKLICIEFNPTIPNQVDFIQAKDFKIKHGASAKSVVKLAARKGYSLVACTTCNVFLIRDDLKTRVIGNQEITLNIIRDDKEFTTHIFSGYDGTIFLSEKSIKMPWHQIEINEEAVQQLPKFLRTYHEDYNFFQKLLFNLYKGFFFKKSA